MDEEPLNTRTCRICNKEKPVKEFGANGRKVAVENRCKSCIQEQEYIRTELKKISPPKPHACECCGKITQKLCFDHDHNSIEFRGWICHPCNKGIGQLGDNIEGLTKALEYLKRHYG